MQNFVYYATCFTYYSDILKNLIKYLVDLKDIY